MDTSSNGPTQQPEWQTEEPRRRRRWPFVVGGLVALGLVGLAVVAVVLILAAGGPTAPPVYDEEYVAGDGPDIVAVVPVEGTIAPADNTLGGTQPTVTPEGLADALRQAGHERRRRSARGQLPWWRGDGKRRDAPEHPGFQEEHG